MDKKKKLRLLDVVVEKIGLEKTKIANASVSDFLEIPGISVEDLKEIIVLQKAIKNGKLLEWLYGKETE